MLAQVQSKQFRQDVKRMQKRGQDMSKLKEVLKLLVEKKDLSARLCDHALKGKLKPYRDLHIEPDWILLYCIKDQELRLMRTGSHADIFR